jgi:putative transposase
MRDNDTKYSAGLDKKVQRRGVKIQKTAFRSPNANAFVERFMQTLGQECLDHFIVFGTEHMDALTKEFAEHYHLERLYQTKQSEVLSLSAFLKAKPGKKKNGNAQKTQEPPELIEIASSGL